MAQLRLLEFMDARGLWPTATLFYSSLRIDGDIHFCLEQLTSNNQIAQVQGQYHAISLYIDTHHTIATALAALALSEPCSPENRDVDSRPGQPEIHPRYQCLNHSEYIATFARPTYLLENKLTLRHALL